MAQPVPKVRVFLDYQSLPVEATRPLQTCILGPHAQLIRYSDAEERLLGRLGALDPLADATYPYPALAAGAQVDLPSVRLFAEDALVRYFEDLIGADETVEPLAGTIDRITIGGSAGFVANGEAYPRLDGLGDRDVQRGDRVRLRGLVDDTEYTLDSYVRSIEAEPTASTRGAATAVAGNGPTQAASATITKLDEAETTNTLAAILGSYDAWPDGVLDETYTLTVTKGSIGGDLSTAELRITSASGLDDVLAIASGDVDTPFEVGHRGLQLQWAASGGVESESSDSDLTVGEQWRIVVHDNYAEVTGTSAGTYSGPDDTTYLIEVTRGGTFAAVDPAGRPQFTVATTTGVDASGPTTVSAAATAYPVGTHDVTIAFSGSGVTGLRKGDRWEIAVTAAGEGLFNILRLGHSLPDGMEDATDLDLTLCVKRDFEVAQRREGFEPDLNYSAGTEEVEVPAGMITYLDGFATDGEPTALDVIEATLFLEYRAWSQDLVGLIDATDLAGLNTAIPGPLVPANPLKWGVFKALENAGGAVVWFASVADPAEATAWGDALELTESVEAIYGLVPLSSDGTVHDLVIAHCADQSAPDSGRFRVCWLGLEAPLQKALVTAETSTDGEVVLATVEDDPDASGTQYTLLRVPAQNADFETSGVRAGDIARYLYSTSWGEESYTEFPIASVEGEDVLKLVTGPAAAVGTPRKLEVWRRLIKSDRTAVLKEATARSGSELVRWVYPERVATAADAPEAHFVACVPAGLRSGVAPHQGLTNVELSGLVAVSGVKLSPSQLDDLAGAGVWIVSQLLDGSIVTRHALTASTVDRKHAEEMFQSNVHSVAAQLRAVATPFIGKTNVTESAAVKLRNELESKLDDIMTNTNIAALGPQVRTGSSVLEVRESLADAASYEVFLDLRLPLPNNRTDLHLTI